MDDMSSDMVFTTAINTPLYTTSWTPKSVGSYAGTCIFLICLAITLRLLFAAKAVLEQRWLAQARSRRYILVQGQTSEAARIDDDPDSKVGLLSVHGIEENVKIVRQAKGTVLPFRLSVDFPRALMAAAIAAVAYLLMLAVMTMNVGYLCSVLGGVFAGELLVGRYAQIDEH